MTIKERFFLVGEEWNVIHLPKKPNGFAVFIIGDENHYVKSSTSSWHQHPSKHQFIEELKDTGYTVIYSNLFGRNWGSDEACRLFKRVYEEVMKKEILNKKVHIIAEGMGAIVAAKVIPINEELYRSVVMINPCLNLQHYFKTEKSNKLFYKRFLKELRRAYHLEPIDLEMEISSMEISKLKPISIPIKILHCMNLTSFSLENHIRPYEKMCSKNNQQVEVAIYLKNKRFNELAKPTVDFFNNNNYLY